MSDNDGGPAFPKPRDPYPNCDGEPYPSRATGMTLRDYFAGQALVGFIAKYGSSVGLHETAGMSYDYANAMLELRGIKK